MRAEHVSLAAAVALYLSLSHTHSHSLTLPLSLSRAGHLLALAARPSVGPCVPGSGSKVELQGSGFELQVQG